MVELRYSLAHIHYTIHHHSLKIAKNIVTHYLECCYSLSPKGFNTEEAWVMQNSMRENKKGQVPRTLKKKEKKRVRREVKMDKCPK